MPVPLAVGDIWLSQFRFYSPAASQLALNNIYWHVISTSGPPPTDLDFATNLWTGVSPSYQVLTTDDTTIQSVLVQRIKPLPKTFPLIFNNNAPVKGAAGAFAAPKNVAGVITLMTQFAGRKYRGRIYVPFPDTSAFDPNSGKPKTAYINSLNNLANIFVGSRSMGGSGGGTVAMQPTVLHRKDMSDDLVVAARANPKWGSIHRRGDYGKINPAPL